MRKCLLVAAGIATLAACSAGTTTGTSGPNVYSAFLVTNYGPATPPNLVLFRGGKIKNGLVSPDSNYQPVLSVVISPEPQSTPPITWNITGTSAQIAPATPTPIPLPTTTPIGETPPPIYYSPEVVAMSTSSPGPSSLSVVIGPPVNITLTRPVFTYPSLVLGCQFANSSPAVAASYAFDPGAAPSGLSSDLFDTLGSDQLHYFDPCFGTPFTDMPGALDHFNFPYYGTQVSGGISDFPAVNAGFWRNDFVVNPAFAATYIFKTKGGRFVKAVLPIGPYQVSAADGTFPY